MARRSQESFQKRAREKARQEKQAHKRAKRQDTSSGDDDVSLSKSEENSLMQEFARLSAQYEADQISSELYDDERRRIFSELGLEPDA